MSDFEDHLDTMTQQIVDEMVLHALETRHEQSRVLLDRALNAIKLLDPNQFEDLQQEIEIFLKGKEDETITENEE